MEKMLKVISLIHHRYGSGGEECMAVFNNLFLIYFIRIVLGGCSNITESVKYRHAGNFQSLFFNKLSSWLESGRTNQHLLFFQTFPIYETIFQEYSSASRKWTNFHTRNVSVSLATNLLQVPAMLLLRICSSGCSWTL